LFLALKVIEKIKEIFSIDKLIIDDKFDIIFLMEENVICFKKHSKN